MVVVSLRRVSSVYYRYNDGKRAKNAFIKDVTTKQVYYFDNQVGMAIGEKTIDGKHIFLAMGCNCVMVTVKP